MDGCGGSGSGGGCVSGSICGDVGFVRYGTRARELPCVIPRVKRSALTSFLYQGVCHWNKLPLEIKQCPSKDTFKYQVKCLLYSCLFVQETSLYVCSLSDDGNK